MSTKLSALLLIILGCVWLQPQAARAGTLVLRSCSELRNNALDYETNDGVGTLEATVPVWQILASDSFGPVNKCTGDPSVGAFQINPSALPTKGSRGQWMSVAPRQISIVDAYVAKSWILVDPSLRTDGFTASFFWQSGNQRIYPAATCCGGMDYASAQLARSFSPSHYFGFAVRCTESSCAEPSQILDIRGVQLVGEDDTPPTIGALGANNIIDESGRWIRGNGWPASFQASADDGICNMEEFFDSTPVQGPYDASPDQGSWTQCPTPLSQYNTVDTTQYADGPLAISYAASDAANPANVGSAKAVVYVDNVTPSISLSGPTDALATAGTQYVTASASAGPSGVSAIYCSLDGGTWRRYGGASARIGVAGVGQHSVSCDATNNAIDPSGQLGASPTETFHLDIQDPTVSSISFAQIADALRCHRAYRWIVIPAQTVIERYHRRKIKVHLPAHRRRISLRYCHARVAYRLVRLGGRWVRRRIVLLPHTVRVDRKRVSFGHGAFVSGWLGTVQGQALGGQRVDILTAPSNGSDRFALATTATTQANGDWRARLPSGPSRLVEVLYPGSPTLAASVSAPVTLTVPSSLTLSIKPRTTYWTGTIHIFGRLRGGYIPAAGELVVLKVGWRGGSAEIGHVYVGQTASFSVRYTFLRGLGTETYRIWASTVRESDYPYAPSSSRRLAVYVH